MDNFSPTCYNNVRIGSLIGSERIDSFQVNKLYSYMSDFLTRLRQQKVNLENIEALRLDNNRELAKLNVQESISLVQGALSCDRGIYTPVLRLQCISVENTREPLQDILSRICVCLFSGCSIKVIAKQSHKHLYQLLTILIDLLQQSGFDLKQVELLVQGSNYRLLDENSNCRLDPNLRDELRGRKSSSRPKESHLSVVSICLRDLDTNFACQRIIECYLGDLKHSNLIILVEESIYFPFTVSWRIASEQLIRSKDSSDIQVDLNCIDMSLAHRMVGRCINVIKFRTLDELGKLMRKLRKVPYIQLWTDNFLLARELCIEVGNNSNSQQRLSHCSNEFWINHSPASRSVRQFNKHLLKFFKDSRSSEMDKVYTYALQHHEDEIERLQKLQLNFMKRKSQNLRTQQVICAYLGLITKFKSMKQLNMTIKESVVRMKRFQLDCLHSLCEVSHEYNIETYLKPLGLAILMIKNKSCIKSKSILVEFIFKNLLVGNGVLLFCPSSLLGAKFPMNLMKLFGLPFGLINFKEDNEGFQVAAPGTGDELTLQSCSTDICEQANREEDPFLSPVTVVSPQSDIQLMETLKCPKNIYALEYKSGELLAEMVDSLVLSLGVKEKSIWYPIRRDEEES